MAFDTLGYDTAAFGTQGPDQNLDPLTIPRGHIGAKDVAIDITHCGVCFSLRLSRYNPVIRKV